MKTDIKDLLPAALTEAISEEGLKTLGAEMERLIEARVQERIENATRCAETAFNETANAKLKKLVVQIDEAHKKAFFEAYNAITEDYDREISKVKRFYNNDVKRESIKFKKELIESISNYIDDKVDSMLPTNQIRKAIKNNTAMQVLESIKKVLAIDEAAALDACRKPFLESTKIMDKQGKLIESLEQRNVELQNKLTEAAREAYLNEKMATLTEDAKNFVRKTLDGASLEYIKENFDYTLKHYKDNLARDKEALAKKTITERTKIRKQVPRIQLVESKKSAVQKPIETNPHKVLASEIISQITNY